MIKKYVEYLKDNPEGKWFKRKLYGWGWTPVKWQGWVVVLASVALIVWNGIYFAEAVKATGQEPTNAVLTWFFVRMVLIVAVLIIICYKKGEKPKWQWGLPKKEEDK
jgi:hypothetical protein